MRVQLCLLLGLLSLVKASGHNRKLTTGVGVVKEEEQSHEYWKEKAQNFLLSRLNQKLNLNKAKNVIFFLGDGMGPSTVSAARMYDGAEEDELFFEKFPHFGLSKTYCVDKQVADSACTSTSYLNGVKANYKTIGVTSKVKVDACEIDESENTESIAVWAQKAGKATGIVTTTRVTHASPAGSYAHVSQRDWESNEDIVVACGNKTNVRDIAYQLVHNEVSKNFKVILGGGRQNFIGKGEIDEEGQPGLRTDETNLIEEWFKDKSRHSNAKYVWHKQQLDEIEVQDTDYLLGLFESDHCMYQLDIDNHNLNDQEPSLTDMTVAAVKMLQKEKNGYFLFVEGGRIDMGHHQNWARKALAETREFSNAIDAAKKMTSESDTLIVVTADHSHVFTYNGYAPRGNDILGFAGESTLDKMPYLTLSYANGPFSSYLNGKRINLTGVDTHESNFRYSADVPLKDETHGGEDVGIYASGPWSHTFAGNFEQNNLPLLMAHAAKIGPYDDGSTDSAGIKSLSIYVLIVSLWIKLVLG